MSNNRKALSLGTNEQKDKLAQKKLQSKERMQGSQQAKSVFEKTLTMLTKYVIHLFQMSSQET